MKTNDIKELKKIAVACRKNVLRMVKAEGSGHLGPAFSCEDILTALYFHRLNVDPKDPMKEDRDIFLLSAGHKAMAQYAAMAEAGYFDKTVLDTFGQFKSIIAGHPCMHLLPGIEANTGSLGHGIAIAAGMALGKRQDGIPATVFVLTGDGELAEGLNWEGVATAAHYGLDNLCIIVDHNGLQISGHTKDVMSYEPVADHFKGFGCAVREINGNDMAEIVEALDAVPFEKGRPSVIVANTLKGCGFSKSAGQASCHYWAYDEDGYNECMAELDQILAEVEA